MKLGFLALPAEERRLYIEQAAIRRNLSPVIMEKDFWVCWLLGILFESEFAGSLVFKGGTSLSKVFGIIERFSEDIDLSLSPEFLKLPDAGTSRNQAKKWMKNAEPCAVLPCKTRSTLRWKQWRQECLARVNAPGLSSSPIPARIRRYSCFITRHRSHRASTISNARSS